MNQKKINLLIIQMATKQDADALVSFHPNPKFHIYRFEDVFSTKYDSKAKLSRYLRYLKRLQPSNALKYFRMALNSVKKDYKFSFDNVRKLAIERLSFDDFRKGIEEFNIQGLIIPTEYPFLNNLIIFAKKTGLKLIVLNKEHVLAPQSPVVDKWVRSKPFRCDLMLCGGSALASVWKRVLSDDNKEKVRITGIPKLDNYFEQKLKSREEVCAILGLDPSKKIVFFPSFKNLRHENSYQFDQKTADEVHKPSDLSFLFTGKCERLVDNRPLKNEILNTMKELVDEYDNMQFIVKLHPDQQPNLSLSTQLEIDAINEKFPRFIGVIGKPDDIDARDIINAADVVVGYQSTMLLEALIMKKPVIVQRWRTSGPEYEIPFAESGACEGAANLSQFKKLIREAVDDPSGFARNHDKGRVNLLEQYFYRLDGKSTERVFKELESLYCRDQ